MFKPRSGKRDTGAIRVIPLGGLGEIGKNMMVIEYRDDIVVIDAGVLFPKEDMLGVDLVLPNIEYLLKHQGRVRAILVTHGHEDHIGALPYVLAQLNVPVYAPPIARHLIDLRLKEHGLAGVREVFEIKPGEQLNLGSIKAEYFQVCHSIPDACGIALHTPEGIVVHTGDFKIDHTPVDGKKIDLQRLAELGKEGVLLLLSDSTYAEESGHTPSEKVVGEALDTVISDASGRVLIATFASLIARVQQVINAAVKHHRKVAIVGRSMVNNVKMAMEKGYIEAPSNVVISYKELKKLPFDQQVIVTTGSQGEPTSVLVRIGNRDHREIEIQEGDTVIISASAIPGNETVVGRTIDNLTRQGARVLTSRTALVHVHGHGSQEDLKVMLSLTKPRYFVPIHGEYRMLAAHANLAKEVGVTRENIFVLEDGDILNVGRNGANVSGQINAGHVFVDGLRQWPVDSEVLKERRDLARDGIVVVIVKFDHDSGAFMAGPTVISSGFIETSDGLELINAANEELDYALKQNGHSLVNWADITKKIQAVMGSYLQARTGRRPKILPVRLHV